MSESIELLKKTIASSAIKRVALIDDSFDQPTVDMGVLSSYLLDTNNRTKCDFIDEELWDAAIQELTEGEDSSATEITEQLYAKYAATQDIAYDPSNSFKTHLENKGFVDPILELLKSCESLEVEVYGSDVTTKIPEHLPDLILIDLYFNSSLSPTETPTEAQAVAAVDASIEKVKHLINLESNNPAVILMSSHGASAGDRAANYRSKIESKVHASRFGFVDKKHVTKARRNTWKVEDAARDTLMDIFQTFEFGKALAQALNRWTSSAYSAVKKIEGDIQNLQLREIAYLVQFRLNEEGQGLEEYLEWFFGEALQNHIACEVDTHHENGSLEKSLDISAVNTIDGAFEPTGAVAKMYHRVRVESKRTRARKNFRLGDLYYNKVKNEVVAVMNPDCDLVLRKNKRNADQLLLVPGKISDLEGISVSVGDFIMIGDKHTNIEWSYKRVFSRPFTECFENPGLSDATYDYLGMLRPLYAQEIQALMLSHIGRVGVAVPPIIGMHAVATIMVKTTAGFVSLSGIHGPTFNCSVLHGRDSKKQPRVIFGVNIIRQIKDTLLNISHEQVLPESIPKLTQVVSQDAKTIVSRLKAGSEIGTALGYDVLLAGGTNYDRSAQGPWAVISISEVKMPTEVVLPENEGTEGTTEVAPPTVGILEIETTEVRETIVAEPVAAEVRTKKPKKGD